ncbi:MAG: glutamate 5-kinase [Bacteroidales bacterium]|nr:glutamate 5-kinase [Bacteroidales bacterium]
MVDKQIRIVVRIEIATLCDKNGRLDRKKMDRLAMVLSSLHNSGKEILVVSSGAIALGSEKLMLETQPESLIEMQATAAIGQAELIRFYQNFFEEYNQIVAQVLLTSDITEYKDRENNARNTFNTLLEMNIIPIINENDPVSTTDIELDDNYPLALKVARIAQADIMIIKLDTNGKYLIIPKGTGKIIVAEDEHRLFEQIDEFVKVPDAKDSGEDFPVSLADISL